MENFIADIRTRFGLQSDIQGVVKDREGNYWALIVHPLATYKRLIYSGKESSWVLLESSSLDSEKTALPNALRRLIDCVD